MGDGNNIIDAGGGNDIITVGDGANFLKAVMATTHHIR